MEQLKLINPENASEEEAESYLVREAARAVVFDGERNVALLHVSKNGYYKLPGGGVDEGESFEKALQRECLEEIGCEVEILAEIGSIVEYRKIFNIKQISYCYLAKIKGEKGIPALEEGEIEDGFKEVWLPYDKALEAITKNITHVFEGKAYIVPRDIIFLKEAEKHFDKLD